jgi:hypothetical protein
MTLQVLPALFTKSISRLYAELTGIYVKDGVSKRVSIAFPAYGVEAAVVSIDGHPAPVTIQATNLSDCIRQLLASVNEALE